MEENEAVKETLEAPVVYLTVKQTEMLATALAMVEIEREKGQLIANTILAGSEYADLIDGIWDFDGGKKTLTLQSKPTDEDVS